MHDHSNVSITQDLNDTITHFNSMILGRETLKVLVIGPTDLSDLCSLIINDNNENALDKVFLFLCLM